MHGVQIAARDEEPVRQVYADVVLSNADYKRTLIDLVGPEHLPSEWLTRARESKMAAALYITFLGIKGDVRDDGMRATNNSGCNFINIFWVAVKRWCGRANNTTSKCNGFHIADVY